MGHELPRAYPKVAAPVWPSNPFAPEGLPPLEGATPSAPPEYVGYRAEANPPSVIMAQLTSVAASLAAVAAQMVDGGANRNDGRPTTSSRDTDLSGTATTHTAPKCGKFPVLGAGAGSKAENYVLIQKWLPTFTSYLSQRNSKFGSSIARKMVAYVKSLVVQLREAPDAYARSKVVADPKKFRATLDLDERTVYVSLCQDTLGLFSAEQQAYGLARQELEVTPHVECIHVLFNALKNALPRDVVDEHNIVKRFTESKFMPNPNNARGWYLDWELQYEKCVRDGFVRPESCHMPFYMMLCRASDALSGRWKEDRAASRFYSKIADWREDNKVGATMPRDFVMRFYWEQRTLVEDLWEDSSAAEVHIIESVKETTKPPRKQQPTKPEKPALVEDPTTAPTEAPAETVPDKKPRKRERSRSREPGAGKAGDEVQAVDKGTEFKYIGVAKQRTMTAEERKKYYLNVKERMMFRGVRGAG